MRGLYGVRLVLPTPGEPLKQAVGTVLDGAAWQRCRAHSMRNLLESTARARETLAPIARTIFAQRHQASALQQLRKIAEGLRGAIAQAMPMVEDAPRTS